MREEVLEPGRKAAISLALEKRRKNKREVSRPAEEGR
jgi:hypothetical protein